MSASRLRCLSSALLTAAACLALTGCGSLSRMLASKPAAPVESRPLAEPTHLAPTAPATPPVHAVAPAPKPTPIPWSEDVRWTASWINQTADNGTRPYAILDKKNARIYVFNPNGRLRSSSPVLLGAARGDDSVPGIGMRKIADILPEERTTPAGRFTLEPGRNANGEDILWVDYDAAVSMHRVRATNPAERRLERLATPTSKDNRISYGCINVPVAFYNKVLSPVFRRSTHGLIYVLPETRPVREVFASATRTAHTSPAAARSRTVPAGHQALD